MSAAFAEFLQGANVNIYIELCRCICMADYEYTTPSDDDRPLSDEELQEVIEEEVQREDAGRFPEEVREQAGQAAGSALDRIKGFAEGAKEKISKYKEGRQYKTVEAQREKRDTLEKQLREAEEQENLRMLEERVKSLQNRGKPPRQASAMFTQGQGVNAMP